LQLHVLIETETCWSNKRFSPIPFHSKAILWQIYVDSNNEFHPYCWYTCHCHQCKILNMLPQKCNNAFFLILLLT